MLSENKNRPLVVFGLAGEGRGHATRAVTIIRHLGPAYRFRVLTSHDAYEFLRAQIDELPGVTLRAIPGMKFFYQAGRLDLSRSIRKGLAYLADLRPRAKRLAAEFWDDPPALVISDFESTVSWAAWFAKVPLVSLDHQHFLLAYDLRCLPWRLRLWGVGMAAIVRAHHTWQARTIVSGFFREPLKRGYEDVVQVGPLIRQNVWEQTPRIDDYTLSYLRPKSASRTLDKLLACDQPMKVYGLGELPAQGKLSFHAFHPDRFIEHLAAAKAVVAAAGNQLIGEALFLGKPYFALPEGRHHEQLINAFFVRRMGVGDFCKLERVTTSAILKFYGRLDEYRANIANHSKFLNGTTAAVDALREMLETKAMATSAR